MGRKLFFDDDQQTPDTMGITFNYPDKVMMFEMQDMESLWDGRNRERRCRLRYRGDGPSRARLQGVRRQRESLC